MIADLLTALWQKIQTFVQWVFNQLFGNWNYGVLTSWLPSDIQAAVTAFILFMFCLALIKFIKNLLPF